MEFHIAKAEFLKGLRLAQSIADRKSTMPMLANALLRTDGDGKLLVAATDLNVSVSAELKSRNTSEGGITVAAKALNDIVANMPGDEITVKKAENNWAEIRSGKVDYRLVGMPDRDFPKIPDHREIEFTEVETGVLRDMFDKTLFSVCNDETRFHLNGVLFESGDDTARMVSTDGHRLSKVDRKLLGAPSLTSGVIIPKKGVVEIKRALDLAGDKCKLAIKTPYVFVSTDSIHLAVKLIESQFPPYEQVIPKDHERTLTVDRGMLLDSLKRAQLMSSETRGVKLSLGTNTVRIASDNPDIGEVREDLEAVYDGEEMSIGFNPKYVIELLGQVQASDVELLLSGELDPVLVRPAGDPDYVGVVMPMRI
ncbi:MAG: DNA polymerase III subunit beta [Deltaproteobacteria bacterium]|nr:DNA polymerase III subunit beta [Deltaproteobacteria bacterium]